MVNLLDKPLNSTYEKLFAFGVDPETPDQLDAANSGTKWPKTADVWQYRDQVYQLISKFIKNVTINYPIHQADPLWALIMSIEHQRIHIETSSMLLRQLPVTQLTRPQSWEYAPIHGQIPVNEMIEIAGGVVHIGKPEDSAFYGWDIDYGDRQIEVAPYVASKYMITNGEFLEFVKAGGYNNQDYWEPQSWQWKNQYQVQHPRFWITNDQGYKYRAMFDEMELPLDWPVEVNHYEAMAYCRWKGGETRLMSEGEWHLATYGPHADREKAEINTINDYNLNLRFGSPSPVGLLDKSNSRSGLADLRGNVWEWLNDDFYPLPGFKTHFLYDNYAAPYFDHQHKMMLGGAWVTNGTEALKFYRNWFRRNFYQHAGFRIAY